ncbi:Snf7-domain-containing protein [Scheffersomyces xylosifermentans]|uniref:Snf7-domain-containing protein n=1 Tax=Scheffersomyces xylosifermentans TaxID=1304137 RepID=UPI00315CFFDE
MGQQPSTPKITAQDRAIFQLKQQRDKLKEYQRRLTFVIDKQTNLARQALKNNQPDRAKFYLRSKKQQESTIVKTCEQLDNLEGLIGTIEFKLIEKDVIYGLEQGNKVLKKLNNEMKIEKIDKILDDLEDEKLKVDEIGDALGMGSGLSKSEEIEVDEEFEKLDQEVNGIKEQPKKDDVVVPDLPEAPQVGILPDAPRQSLEEAQKQEEEENKDKQAQTYEPIAS